MTPKFYKEQKVRILPKNKCKIGIVNWLSSSMDIYQNMLVTINSIYQGDDYVSYLTNEIQNFCWDENWLVSASNFRCGDTIKLKESDNILQWQEDMPFKDEDLILVSRKQLI